MAGRAIGGGVERHEIDDHAVIGLAIGDRRQHTAIGGQRLIILPAEARRIGNGANMDHRRTRITRACHGQAAGDGRVGQFGPA